MLRGAQGEWGAGRVPGQGRRENRQGERGCRERQARGRKAVFCVRWQRQPGKSDQRLQRPEAEEDGAAVHGRNHITPGKQTRQTI